MTERQSLIPAPPGAVSVTTCWMCGIRLSPGYMVADGGSACADVRWYCLDVRGCTERWTARLAGSADLGDGTGEASSGAVPVPDLPGRPLASTGSAPGSGSR
jgi:hypothetical protein